VQEAESKWISRGAFLAVAAAYASSYVIVRYVSFSHWNLMAGLRFIALLVVPRRYWPALLLGEWVPLIEVAVFNSGKFGLEWALLMGIPQIALCMPVVALAKRRMALPYRGNGEVNMAGLMILALACALIAATMSALALMQALLASPGKWPEATVPQGFALYFLGAYPGALALAPTILVLKDVLVARRWIDLRSAWKDPLAMGLIVASAAAWVLAARFAPGMHGAQQQLMRMSTLLPVLALTLRFGWKGAAVAGFLADAAMAFTSTTAPDLSMLPPKAVLALVLSGALLVGVPITRWWDARAMSR
jgi:glucose-6-phosphate-specific signal transduction histidine kinase